MISVNTNLGAMVALQTLTRTQNDLAEVQNRVSTGLRVASAKDDGGVFAIAQNMRGDVGARRAIEQSLGRLGSVIDVATAAGTAVSDLLVQMKEKALAAMDASTDATSRAALNNDFVALRDQISSIVANASFNGVNMINAAGSQTAIASTDGASVITVANENLSLGGAVVTVAAASAVDTVTNATATLALVNASITNVGNSLARLGAGSKRLELQKDFNSKISDALTSGIGNLVDANMAQESAALQALQVKQQLGVQALSIANQAPSTILALFR